MEAEEVDFSSAPQKKWKADLTKWNEELVHDTALAIRDYLYIASCGEARHAWSMANMAIPELRKQARHKTYTFVKDFGPSEHNVRSLMEVFGNPWRDGSYGGKRWLKIIEAVTHYGEWPDSIFIDHAADLQHNGGGVFSKDDANTVLDFTFNVDRQTLQKWFYNKAKNNILKVGNSGGMISAASTTKKLLNKFFVTRKMEKPTWTEGINTIPVESTRYTYPKWGTKKFSEVQKTLNSWSIKKSVWPCICQSCIPVVVEEEMCDQCGAKLDWCECCGDCGKYEDSCTMCGMCGICGSHDCNHCFHCDMQACEHEYPCCDECQQQWDECECCNNCGETKDFCELCKECDKDKCEHLNNKLCCEDCAESPCECENKESIDGKEEQKEQEEKEENLPNSPDAETETTKAGKVLSVSQR